MNGSQFREMAFRTLLTFPELSSILVGALQIVGVAFGIFVLRWRPKQDSSWVYLVCLSGVFSVLMLLPLHLARIGWAFSIPFVKHEPSEAVLQFSIPLEHSASLEPTLDSFPMRLKPLPVSEQELSFDEAITVANLSDVSPPTNSWSVLQIAILVYAIIVLSQLIRTARGWQRLRRAAQRGRFLGERSSRIVDQCRDRLKISTRVQVLRSTEVSMPLTFGVLRPVILLPADFEEWTTLEQQAVALHEFSHIARRDVIGELMVRGMQASYWLHPASHWIAKQVRAVREEATDQRVIATGFSPQEYARCLVQILQRERTCGGKRRDSFPSIAMSAFGDMEVRINSILQGEEKMDFARRSIWIICLVLFMCFSMVRLQAVLALSKEPILEVSASEPIHPNASPSSALSSSAVETDDSNPSPKNDLLDLIQNAPVTSNVKTPDGFALNLSGRVLTPNGEPARGCTVVLSRFTVQRAKKKRGLEKQDYNDTYTLNLLARTTTDEEGRYSIDNIFAPDDLPPNGDERHCSFHLIAGDSEMGIGWEDFLSVNDQRIKREINIRLNAIDSIEGQCINTDGTPAENTNVTVVGLRSKDDSDSGLFLSGALQTNTSTDSSGRFQFLHFPRNAIASISASGEGGFDHTLLRIGTKQGSNSSGLEQITDARGMQVKVQSGPALLTLRKPIQVPIYVFNTDREPVPGAIVSVRGMNSQTDEQGRVLWNADVKTTDVTSNHDAKVFTNFETDSPYLSTQTSVTWDSIAGATPIEIIVEKGTRIRGKVITKEGHSAHGVLLGDVKHMLKSGSVDEQGNFELTLPSKKCRLVLYGLRGGYRIPCAEQVRALYGSTSGLPQNWKCIDVDASSGEDMEIPTIVVEKMEPINIVAQLPDGSPATNAMAILTDINISEVDRNARFSKCFLSTNAFIDSNGLATILPNGIPSKLASVEVRLLHKNIPYLGIVGLDQLSAGKLLVRLKPEWLIRGRVTLDGQPLAGAWVHAIRHITPNGETLRPESVLHARMSTNQLGEYEFIMPRDRDYEIQVSGLPQDRMCYGSTHKLTPRSSNEMEVPEFRYEQGTESITGTVLNLKGEPIAGANVSILDREERRWIGQFKSSDVKSDKSGHFVLPNLPHGPFRLGATWREVPNRTVSSSEIMTSSGETNVRLTVPTNQRGVLVD